MSIGNFMNIGEILNGIKGKVLELKDIELLKSAYDLQNKVNEQLQSLNAAISDSRQLQSEKIDQLERECSELRSENEKLRAKVASLEPPPTVEPTQLARDILNWYRDRDKLYVYDDEIRLAFSGRAIELESTLSELIENKLLDFRIMSPDRGRRLELTPSGRAFVLGLPSGVE